MPDGFFLILDFAADPGLVVAVVRRIRTNSSGQCFLAVPGNELRMRKGVDFRFRIAFSLSGLLKVLASSSQGEQRKVMAIHIVIDHEPPGKLGTLGKAGTRFFQVGPFSNSITRETGTGVMRLGPGPALLPAQQKIHAPPNAFVEIVGTDGQKTE
jgi:hypothetical protein